MRDAVGALLAAVVLVHTQACGHVTADVGRDSGFAPYCDELCMPPLMCDPVTALCSCPPDTCCWETQCYCVAGERSCEDNEIDVCEPVEMVPEDGLCGTVCSFEVERSCAEGCGWLGSGRPFCVEDLCHERPDRRYSLAITTSAGQEYGCAELALPGQELTFELTGDASRLDDGRFVVFGADGLDATVVHDVEPELLECLGASSGVTVQATFRLTENAFCVRELRVETVEPPGEVVLLVHDGSVMDELSGWYVYLLHLGCPDVAPDGACGATEVFGLELYLWEQAPIRLQQGQTGYTVQGDWLYRVRNLRSFRSGECDDDTNVAFAVARACP